MSFQCWTRKINFTWPKHFLQKTNCATPQTLYNKILEPILIDKIKVRGHPELNQGPLDLQSNALPLSYIPVGYRRFFLIIRINFCSPYGSFPWTANIFCRTWNSKTYINHPFFNSKFSKIGTFEIFWEKMFLLLALFGVHFADELHSSFYEWENKKVVEKINDLKKYQMFDNDGKHFVIIPFT